MQMILNDIVPGSPEAAAKGCICTVEDDGKFLSGVLTATCPVHGARVLSKVDDHRVRESASDLLPIVDELLVLHAEMQQMRDEDIRKTINLIATAARDVRDWIDEEEDGDKGVRVLLGRSG